VTAQIRAWLWGASLLVVGGGVEPAWAALPSGELIADELSPPDVVEVIPDPDAPPPLAPPRATAEVAVPAAPPVAVEQKLPSAPPSPAVAADRFALTGWARQSVELGFSNDALRPNQPERTALPYDRAVARSQLFMQARYSRGNWFEADVSGQLAYAVFEQGPAHESTPFNGFNGQSARGALEGQLRELFVGFFSSRLDVRIGQQRIAWGKGDFVSPNDVMNARDTRDPFVGETELLHLPTFAIRADLDLGIGTLEGVFSPVFTPDRFDVSGSNWAAIQPDAPTWVRGVANLIDRSTDASLRPTVQRLLSATNYPKSDFSEPVVGARWTWNLSRADVSYYYQYGFDGPLLEVDPALVTSLRSLDYSQAGLADLEPLLRAIDAGQAPIRLSYLRRHHVGMDASTTWGPLAFRVDTAFDSKRAFIRRDFLGTTSPTFQGLASIEYQTGDTDKDLLIEVIYQHLFDKQAIPVLIYARDTVGIAGDLRWPVWGPVTAELRALVGLRPESQLVQPQLNVKFGALVLSAGGLLLRGAQYSYGQYFQRNDEAYLKAKYSF
jgi:hypothetical protein